MEPSKPNKPVLPRLTTDIPPEERGRRSVFARNPSPERNRKPERVPRAPTLLQDENLPPSVRYGPSKTFHVRERSSEEAPATRKVETKSTYYEEAFSSRGSHNSPKERIIQDSVVIAELTTSAKVRNSTDLMMDLSRHLALVYQRPEAAILLTIREEAPLSFGNISLPAYLLKIYALPSIIAPTTNLRSTAMLSDELQELLGVGPEFGVIVFIPVPQDNLATNKTTAGGEISRTERAEQAESPSLIRSFGQTLSRRRLKSSSGGSSAPITSPISLTISAAQSQPPQSANDDDIVVTDRERRRQLGVKKSVQNFMRRRLRDKPAESKEGDQQQPQQESDQVPPEEVQTSEPTIPKREDKVLRWQDQQ